MHILMIGVGQMRSNTLRRLVRALYSYIVFDRSNDAMRWGFGGLAEKP